MLIFTEKITMTEKYITQYTLRYREVNRHGLVKAATWFDFMQEAAAAHATRLELGYSGLQSMQCFWVLARLQLKVLRQPAIGETLTLETWPGSFRRLFANRHFRFLGKDGKECAVASSQWMIISAVNGRPQRVDIVADRLPDNHDLPAYFSFEERMASVEENIDAVSFPVRFSMEDINGHLNNAEYAGIAQDWVEEKLAAPVGISEIGITFHSACLAPETLKVCGEKQGDKTFCISGYRPGGNLSFSAVLTYSDIQ